MNTSIGPTADEVFTSVRGGDPRRNTDAPQVHEPTGRNPDHKLLSDTISKKGSRVLAFGMSLPGDKCPFASAICERNCYAKSGQFLMWMDRYRMNYETTRTEEFVPRVCIEILHASRQNAHVWVCFHERADFYSLEYCGKVAAIITAMRTTANVSFFCYTRCWTNPRFRDVLGRIAEAGPRSRVNLSTDRELVEKHGVPKPVGDGLVTYLAEHDGDIPPAGIDLVFRNLRGPQGGPLETIGGVIVCPHESSLYTDRSIRTGWTRTSKAVAQKISCQTCRICLDRTLQDWKRVSGHYRGVPGEPARDSLFD